LRGTTKQAASKIIKMLWNSQPETANRINEMIRNLNLPESYVGLHIRGGDKSVEADFKPPELYIELAKKYFENYNFFVLTDDYRIITELKTKFPIYNFYTLCEKHEQGYYHDQFCKDDSEKIFNSTLKLLASMEILMKSSFFVGTFSSNPGMFMGMIFPESKVKCVDFDKWTIW
jgi:hypothetical protein